MPRKSKKIVENLDHAFELTLIIITIISATIAQIVASDEQEINIPPIIANMQRLSIVFIFPSIVTILAWIAIYFTDNETLRMRLRTYAWSSVIFLIIVEIIELFAVCSPQSYPQWVDSILMSMIFITLFFPFIPFLLIVLILDRYKIVLKNIDFFTEKGKVGTSKRYIPFCLSYIAFWITFEATTFV